jgi:hypothetical protein
MTLLIAGEATVGHAGSGARLHPGSGCRRRGAPGARNGRAAVVSAKAGPHACSAPPGERFEPRDGPSTRRSLRTSWRGRGSSRARRHPSACARSFHGAAREGARGWRLRLEVARLHETHNAAAPRSSSTQLERSNARIASPAAAGRHPRADHGVRRLGVVPGGGGGVRGAPRGERGARLGRHGRSRRRRLGATHVGFAMSRIDEHEAQATLHALRALGEVYEQELEDLRSSDVI